MTMQPVYNWSLNYAHVKWFIDDHGWKSQSLEVIIAPAFLLWLGVTILVLLAATIINKQVEQNKIARRVIEYLDRFSPYQMSIFRIGIGLGLLLQLCTGSYLAPTFQIGSWWVGATLLVAILGLLNKRTLPLSGVLLTVLYFQAIYQYGLFHSLDYIFYIGVVYYLCVVNSRWKGTTLPVLYMSTGLSLAWLSMEKMTMPGLASSLVHEYKITTFGFSVPEFVLISAFIELALGWVLILGFMNRFSALILTGMFLLTSTVFGFKEIVGHTVVHTLLLMFLIEGKGQSRGLYQFHKPLGLRLVFVGVNLCLLLGALLPTYIWMQQFG